MAEPSKEVKVRPMVETDLPRVNEIDRMLFGDQRVPTWPFSFEVYWTVHEPKLKLVAEVSNQVVGFVVGTIVEEEHSLSVLNLRHSIGRPTKTRLVGWIDMIGVDIQSQGLGVGRTLVQAFSRRVQTRRRRRQRHRPGERHETPAVPDQRRSEGLQPGHVRKGLGTRPGDSRDISSAATWAATAHTLGQPLSPCPPASRKAWYSSLLLRSKARP